MEAPIHPNNRIDHPDCFDLSPERLNSMSSSELEKAMEEAMSKISEENYDPAVIDAYLDALDRKAPMPDYPDAKASYAEFQHRVQEMPAEVAAPGQAAQKRRKVHFRSVLRLGIAAALVTACLFGSMVVAQASGFDVFGAIARWTDSIFTFGGEAAIAEEGRNDFPVSEEIPEEYQDVQAALAERGLPLYFLEVPEGYDTLEPSLFIDPSTNCVGFTATYTQGTDCITFDLEQSNCGFTTIYEKTDGDVEQYEYDGITFYIFDNTANKTVTWVVGAVEYSIGSTQADLDVKDLIHSVYKGAD